jgi:FkbM family methyltransferase
MSARDVSASATRYLRDGQEGRKVTYFKRKAPAAMSVRFPVRRYDPSRPVAFMHVPKTSGNALIIGLLKALAPRQALFGLDRSHFGTFRAFDTMNSEIRSTIDLDLDALPKQADFIAGHFSFLTLSTKFDGAQLITFLREPYSRLLSHWLFLRSLSDDQLSAWGDWGKLGRAVSSSTFANFLAYPLYACNLDNLAVRMLLWPHPLIPADDFIDPRNDDVLISAAMVRLQDFAYTDIIENPAFQTNLQSWIGRELSYGKVNETASIPPERSTTLDQELTMDALALADSRTRLDIQLWTALAEHRVSAQAVQTLLRHTVMKNAVRYSRLTNDSNVVVSTAQYSEALPSAKPWLPQDPEPPELIEAQGQHDHHNLPQPEAPAPVEALSSSCIEWPSMQSDKLKALQSQCAAALPTGYHDEEIISGGPLGCLSAEGPDEYDLPARVALDSDRVRRGFRISEDQKNRPSEQLGRSGGLGTHPSESLAQQMMLSYAQNGEDVVLSRAFADQKVGFYIDIGACHPVDDSVTLHFYERGWHGVNVEPDRDLHAQLQQSRLRDVNLLAAVAQTRGRMEFHPTGTRGHGTLDTSLASERSVGRAAERVPTFRLSDVIDCYGPDAREIDFLKIDVEGWEAEVIASGDWVRHRARVLVIEAVDDKGHPSHQSWEPSLLGSGYRFALFDGLNRFYCRDEDAESLLPRLSIPANVLDGWRRAADVQAHESLARLQAERAAAGRRALNAEERSEALGADLEDSRASERAAVIRAEVAAKETARLEGELATAASQMGAAKESNDALAVDAARARAEAAAALRREEAAEARMAALEMELIRRDSAERALRAVNEQAQRAANEQAQRAANESAAAAAWITAIHTSTSWRVTAPLRAGGLLLRGLLGRR